MYECSLATATGSHHHNLGADLSAATCCGQGTVCSGHTDRLALTLTPRRTPPDTVSDGHGVEHEVLALFIFHRGGTDDGCKAGNSGGSK